MKRDTIDNVRTQLYDGHLDEAELCLTRMLHEDEQDSDVHYWLGNLHRQRNNWKLALQCYAKAIELNPHSEANEAREMLLSIVQFRDVQRYNV